MSLVPFVVEDTGRGERSMDIFSRLLMDRIVFIGGPINDQIANLVIAQILFLKMDNPKKEISIYIHSPGGYVTSGLAIYDTIQFLSCDVNTYCIGMAASISALILACGTKGKRFALPNGRVMIHQPSGAIGGTSSDIEKQADEIVLLKQKIATIMSNHCSRSAEQILIDSDRDFYMSPVEAKEYGLIDHVVTKQTSEESKNTAGKT